MGKHTGGVSFAALKGNKGRFSTLFATQKGDCREAIAFLRRNMKQEKHEIRCSEIEKRLGKYCFFEKSYKNTRTKNGVSLWGYTVFVFPIKGTRKFKCNSPVDCCLPPARRRQHLSVTSPFWRTLYNTQMGLESPWESPFPFRCGNQIALPPDGKGIDFLRQFDYNAWYKQQLRRQFHD